MGRRVVAAPLFACGSQQYGQLGLLPVPRTPQFGLQQVTALAWKYTVSIAAGARHSLALTSTGELYGWGWNHMGQVGVKSKSRICYGPTEVFPGNDRFVCSIGAGQWHSLCAAYIDESRNPQRRGLWHALML